jgi:hypothetical protein
LELEREFLRERLKPIEILVIARTDHQMLFIDIFDAIDTEAMVTVIGTVDFKTNPDLLLVVRFVGLDLVLLEDMEVTN